MADPIYGTPRFKLGDRVRIRHGYGWKGPIVEWRGPLAPGGVQVYRVRIQKRPTEQFVEVREDQLILLPPKADRAAAAGSLPTTDPAPDTSDA